MRPSAADAADATDERNDDGKDDRNDGCGSFGSMLNALTLSSRLDYVARLARVVSRRCPNAALLHRNEGELTR
jgi:hypothetical protein